MSTGHRPTPHVGFAHDEFLRRFATPDRYQPWDDSAMEAIAADYAEALRAELQPLVSNGEIQTHGRRPDEAGGPGVEFDFVALIVAGGVAAGYYAGYKEIAKDLRAVLAKLATLGDGRTIVDEDGAVYLAIESIATDEPQDIELKSVEVLRGDKENLDGDRGFLVHVSVNGVANTVVVASGGSVIGATVGLRGWAARPPGIDAPPPEPPIWEKPPGATDNGTWVEDEHGAWQWLEYPDESGPNDDSEGGSPTR